MEDLIKNDLHHELQCLQKDFFEQWPASGKNNHVRTMSADYMLKKAMDVITHLQNEPYLSGKAVGERCDLDKDQLAILYKLIQRSAFAQRGFKTSQNRDYFNVVNHYFNNRQYTLVFFVGTTCPSRCIYCPNVRVDKQGRRRLVSYGRNEPTALNESTLSAVFDDLESMKKNGSDILVKISGGLEPLTDIRTIAAIIRHARSRSLPVKLFTNGLLFADPVKRSTVLQANDIRISLSTSNEEEYQRICFSAKQAGRGRALANLKKNIRKLVDERNKRNAPCRIGLNSIILPANHREILSLLEMAQDLGIDYIDFKPDYFSSYSQDIAWQMEASVKNAQAAVSRGDYEGLYVNFTCSLFRDDLYWNEWPGTCDALRQSEFKLFITPFGECSPVHYGAFPHAARSIKGAISSFSIGEIGPRKSLFDVLNEPTNAPEIDMKKLNPFELMLSLEIKREEEDQAMDLTPWGSPYHTNARNRISEDLFARVRIEM